MEIAEHQQNTFATFDVSQNSVNSSDSTVSSMSEKEKASGSQESDWNFHLDVLGKLKSEDDWEAGEKILENKILYDTPIKTEQYEYEPNMPSLPQYQTFNHFQNYYPENTSAVESQPCFNTYPGQPFTHQQYSHNNHHHHHLHSTYSPPPPQQIPHFSSHAFPPSSQFPENGKKQEKIIAEKLVKRRGRKPKHIKLLEAGADPEEIAAARFAHAKKRKKWDHDLDARYLTSPATPEKPRKKIDRFNGIPEEEVAKRTLPDHLGPNLDIIIVGINPGMIAAYKGHHYAGPGNHFWKCLYVSGIIPEPYTADDDHKLLEHGIGFTNMVTRTTKGSADLTKQEIREGGEVLITKLQYYQPLIVVFNGKGIYEVFSGKKDFCFGRQPEKIEGTETHIWVMPSSSARCAQLPRAMDKVPFYVALRKFRDYLKGTLKELREDEIVFSDVKLRNFKKESDLKAEAFDEDSKDSSSESGQFDY